MTTTPLDNRPTLHYRGEVSQDMVGQVVGPNLFGELYTFAEVTYDRVADRSTVRLRNATEPEVAEWNLSISTMARALVNPS